MAGRRRNTFEVRHMPERLEYLLILIGGIAVAVSVLVILWRFA